MTAPARPTASWPAVRMVGCAKRGIIFAQLLLGLRFVIVRNLGQEAEGEHVITKIVRVHCPAQLVGNVPEILSQLFLVLVIHGFGTSFGSGCWLSSSAEIRRSCPSFTMTKLVPV